MNVLDSRGSYYLTPKTKDNLYKFFTNANGKKLTRDKKYLVGKKIGNDIYFHKDYIDTINGDELIKILFYIFTSLFSKLFLIFFFGFFCFFFSFEDLYILNFTIIL